MDQSAGPALSRGTSPAELTQPLVEPSRVSTASVGADTPSSAGTTSETRTAVPAARLAPVGCPSAWPWYSATGAAPTWAAPGAWNVDGFVPVKLADAPATTSVVRRSNPTMER